jgi:hypothetical protein
MIELTQQQRQALEAGEPVATQVGGKAVILLQEDLYRWIQGTLTTERAVIEAGHTRGPVQPPALLANLGRFCDRGLSFIVTEGNLEELQELAQDARQQREWVRASERAAVSWMKENSDEP